MAVEDHSYPAPEHVAALAAARRNDDGLVLYPDRVSRVGDEFVSGFRDDAQELRVAALEADIPVELALADETRAGQYTEHSADWVMTLVGVPTGVVAGLITNGIQRRLDALRQAKPGAVPTVRYREVESKATGDTYIREIEGPADEVIEWLRRERAGATQIEPGDDEA